MASTPWRTKDWFVSPWNFAPEVTANWRFPKQIQFHDVTLRDGEQQSRVVFTKQDKIRIAEKLAEAGVHRIEAGTPAVSQEDADAVREIVRRKLGPKTFVLTRCMVEDVKRAADLGIDGAVVEIPCSEHMVELAYRWPLEKAIDLSIKATRAAHEAGLYVVFFPIDSTRSDIDWYLTLIERVAKEGHMDALALVDTTGTISPHAIPLMVKSAQARVNKPLEVHVHSDFGHSVSNTIMALAAGVEVAHVTVAGMGERAGNAPLEDTAVSLLLQYGIDTGIKTEKLYGLSKLVRQLSGHAIPHNRQIVGDGIFEVESGIVVDWWYNCGEPNLLEVFPFRPELVGHPAPDLVLSKLSGRPSIVMALDRIGVKATEAQIAEILLRVKELSIVKKGALTQEEFEKIVAKSLTPASKS